mgnify:CR=1 FL=1
MSFFKMLFGDLWGMSDKLTHGQRKRVWVELGKPECDYTDEDFQDAIWQYVNSGSAEDKQKVASFTRGLGTILSDDNQKA